MKRSTVLKWLFGIFVVILLLVLSMEFIVEPLIRQKIQKAIDNSVKSYSVVLKRVHVNLIRTEMIFAGIKIQRKDGGLHGVIPEIRLKGIHVLKILFSKEIHINNLRVKNMNFNIQTPFRNEVPGKQILTPFRIRIDKIVVELADLKVTSDSSAQQFWVHDGKTVLDDLNLDKNDTVTLGDFQLADFNIKQFVSVTSDSNYSIKALEIDYKAQKKTLYVKGLQYLPNFSDYVFADRFKYETDRFNAEVSDLTINNFTPLDFLDSRDLVCSYITIDTFKMEAFRDKRKEFRHVPRKTFQDELYDYPGLIRIDSLAINTGTITYIEHAEEAREAGYLTFKKIHVRLKGITNDTSYKDDPRSINLYGAALLMGKGNLQLTLKAPLFDPQNTFSVDGSLGDMNIEDLNPILENSTFMFITGNIDVMKFHFIANNTKSDGTLSLIYHDLDVTVKSKSTGDTTALKERLTTLIANWKLKDSNPLPGADPRMGIIEFQRDPERFIFNYFFKSILSGIKTTVTNQNSKKNP